VCIGGLIFFYIIRGDTYLDLTALIPVALGWAAAFAIVVSSHLVTFQAASMTEPYRLKGRRANGRS
jgi:hypothetical protein